MIFACVSWLRDQYEFGTATFGQKPVCNRETVSSAAAPTEAQAGALTYHV